MVVFQATKCFRIPIKMGCINRDVLQIPQTKFVEKVCGISFSTNRKSLWNFFVNSTNFFHKPKNSTNLLCGIFFSTKSLCGICKSQNITVRGGNLKRWKTHGQLYNENIMQSSTNMTAAQASKKFPTMLRKNI